MATHQDTLDAIERIKKIDQYLLDPICVKNLLLNHVDYKIIINRLRERHYKVISIIYPSSGCLLRSIENNVGNNDPPCHILYYTLEEARKVNPYSNMIKTSKCENSFIVMIGTHLPTKMLGYDHDSTDIYCTTELKLDMI
jgi:hypothetical protein